MVDGGRLQIKLLGDPDYKMVTWFEPHLLSVYIGKSLPVLACIYPDEHSNVGCNVWPARANVYNMNNNYTQG